jgi:protein gp37
MDVFEDNPQLVDWRVDLFRLIEKTPALTWLLLTKRPENIIQMTVWGAPGCRMPKNVWIGTTVENQDVAQKRLDHLIEVPADVHFISVEPQIGPVSISRWLGYEPDLEPSHGVDWVIVGGESGATCRPFQVEWARSLLKQCRENNIAFFMKQLGGYPNKRHDLSDFPDDLKIREFPR